MTDYEIKDGWKDYGDLSAVEPWHRVSMQCEPCNTRWYGCWDNFQCPECGGGELPKHADIVAHQAPEVRRFDAALAFWARHTWGGVGVCRACEAPGSEEVER